MMESVQLLVQGVPAATAGSSEQPDSGQSLDGAEAAGFTALLVSLLSPQQPMPEVLTVIPVKPENSGQAIVAQVGISTESSSKLSAAFSLIRPDSDTADSLATATRITPALDAVPVKGVKTDPAIPAEEATVQQLLPESAILLKLVPINQGKASETGFKLEAVQQSANMSQPRVNEGPVQVVSVPLSAIDNGEVILPLRLPTGEQVTLLLKDLPGEDTAKATGLDRKAQVAPARSAHETRENTSVGTPAASGDVIRVILQVKPSPAAQELSNAANVAGEGRKESGDVIKVILQVKPSTPHPAQATRVEPAVQATDNGNRVVLQTKPSMPLPVENPQAGAAVVTADTTPEPPSVKPAVFTVKSHETVQHRGEAGNVGVVTTVEAEPLPAANQAMDVKAKAAPEIRVLNHTSRSVEIVMQQEPANGQAVVESVSRSAGTSEKSPVAETGGSEAALPGKPAKGTLVADAVTGKETVSTVASPATGFSEKVAEVAAQAKPEVAADDLIDQVVQKAASAGRNIPSPSEITVRLQPEHLGNLQMKVAVEGDQVAVKIHVESPLAKQMLENNLGQLRESLGSVGLRTDSISVSLGMNSGWERGQNPMWQDGRGQNAYPAMHREAEPRRQEQFITTPRAYPVKVDRLLDMTI